MTRYMKKYKEEVLPKLLKENGEKNPMRAAKLKKIVVSMGLAEASKDKNNMQDHFEELSLLTGQKPVFTKAKKAISNFKLREAVPIGLKVTLRGKRMYDFLDRFCNIVSPRVRDFRGFKQKGDGKGCYHVGLDDQQVFPELNLDKVKRSQGMNIAFVTSATTDDECLQLLKYMGFPFKH